MTDKPARETKGEPKCTVLLAYDYHNRPAFIQTLIDSLEIIKRIGRTAFCFEAGVNQTLEQLISKYKHASMTALKYRYESYYVLEHKTRLLESIAKHEISFCAMDMSAETKRRYESYTLKNVDARNRHMVGEIKKQCDEHKNNENKIVVVLVGAAHFRIKELLEEKNNTQVLEIVSDTPSYETMEHIKQKLVKHNPCFVSYCSNSAAKDYTEKAILAAIAYLHVACMFLANEEIIAGCGKYKFDGLKLNYTDPTANNTELLKKYLEFNFPHLLIADSDPEAAAVQLYPSVDQTTQQMKGSSFENSPAELRTAGNLSENVPEIAAVPIGDEL